MSTADRERFDPARGDGWPRGDDLDALLGLDPTPKLSPDAVRAIHERLQGENDGALDALLGLDVVEVPRGLSAGVLERVASERRASRRRRTMRLVPMALAAAAALTLVLVRGRGAEGPRVEPAPGIVAGTDGRDSALPSDEMLATLAALEDLEFLAQELEPLEAEALFLLDEEDELLLDLFELGG